MIPVLLDRTHKRWFVGSTLVAAIGAAAYLGNALNSIHGSRGGSVLGMLFGILGSACMIFAALLAVRRRLPTLRVGSAQFWLRGHMWLGTVGFVLILLHSGFRWGGLLENLMWVAFVLVVVTGFFGVILQQIIPRLLTSEVPLETIVSQIPSLSNMSVFQADKIVASKVGLLEVDFEPLRMDALCVLKRQEQSIGDRPGDFPKELAKVYANVPIIETNKPPPVVHSVAPIVQTKPPLAPLETPPADIADGASSSKQRPPLENQLENAAVEATGVEPAKLKSRLEIMREKAAAKAAGVESEKPKTSLEILREKTMANAAGSRTAKNLKKMTPLEIMRAKAAAKTPSDGPSKSKTPLEIMRDKAAARAAESEPSKSKTPVGLMRGAVAADAVVGVGPGTKSSLDILRERGVPTLAADEAAEPPNAIPAAGEKTPASIEQMSARDDAPVGVSLMSGKPTKPLISITCERCGKVFTVAPRHAGKKGRCPVKECQAAYTVPFADEPPVELVSAELPASLAAPVVEKKGSVIGQFKDKLTAAISLGLRPKKPMISMMCANCGKVFTVSARHAGEEGVCPVKECQAPYTVPQPAVVPVESARPPREGDAMPLAQNKPLRIIQGDDSRLSLSDEDSVETFGPFDQIPAPLAPNKTQTLPIVDSAEPLSPIPVQRDYNVAMTLVGDEPETPVEQIPVQRDYNAAMTLVGDEPETPLAPIPVQREYNAAMTLVGDEPEAPLAPIPVQRDYNAAMTLVGDEPETPVEPIPVQREYNVAMTLVGDEPETPVESIPVQREYNAAMTLVGDEPETPLAPIEQVPVKPEPSVTPAPSNDQPAKKLSPLEKMRANKLAAAKGAPADQPAGTPKPLTIERSTVDPPVAEKLAPAVPAKPRPKKVPAPIAPDFVAVLRNFHIDIVRPFLISGRSPKRRLEDSDSARQIFTQMRAELPAELHDALQQLFVLCEERRQFNTQLRLHRWLHWWLLVHIPPSIALLVLFVAHVVVSLRVVPFVW